MKIHRYLYLLGNRVYFVNRNRGKNIYLSQIFYLLVFKQDLDATLTSKFYSLHSLYEVTEIKQLLLNSM